MILTATFPLFCMYLPLSGLLRQGVDVAVKTEMSATSAAEVDVDQTTETSAADERGGDGNFGGPVDVKLEGEGEEEEEEEDEEKEEEQGDDEASTPPAERR